MRKNCDLSRLNARILRAHSFGDQKALVQLYHRAATELEAGGETDAACFFLTQAYVCALEAGDPLAGPLRDALIARGRELSQGFWQISETER